MIFLPGSIQGALRDKANNDVWDLVGTGAPTSGTSGTAAGLAGPGSTYTDYTNKIIYLNTNTKASPTWGAIATIAGVQTLTNKTLTSPTINTGTLNTPAINAPVFSDYKALLASQTYTSTTIASTLTGLSWAVVPGTYLFELNLPTTMTANGGLSLSYLLTTAVLASIRANNYAATASDNTTAVSAQVTATVSATKLFNSNAAAYTLVTVKGSFVVGTGGQLDIQATQNVSNSDTTTVLSGAYGKLERVL